MIKEIDIPITGGTKSENELYGKVNTPSHIEFRQLKNNILLSCRNGQPVQSILTAGSIHGEGSSLVSRHLACSMADHSGKKVLFMDFNFRSRRSGRNKKSVKGLSDFFLEDLELESIVQASGIPNLNRITRGCQECDPTGIISHENFFTTLSVLQKTYAYIIVDTAPLQYYPESALLASKVDGVLLVVQAEKTKREIVMDTRKKLDRAQANILGVVLNKKKNYIPKLLYSLL